MNITFSLPLHRQTDKGATREFFNIMKRSELEKRMTELGYRFVRHGRRHDKWVNPANGIADWVPRHASEIATGTALSILRKLAGE